MAKREEIQNLTYLFSCENMCAQFDLSKSALSEGLTQDIMADSIGIIAATTCAVGLLATASGLTCTIPALLLSGRSGGRCVMMTVSGR